MRDLLAALLTRLAFWERNGGRVPPRPGEVGGQGVRRLSGLRLCVQARAKRHPVHGSVRYLVRIEVRPREVVLWVNTFLLLNHSPLHIFGSRGNSTSGSEVQRDTSPPLFFSVLRAGLVAFNPPSLYCRWIVSAAASSSTSSSRHM